jgi:hypothetical protein
MTSSSARAEASRRNGARSRGPVTAAGKARSVRDAAKHRLRTRHVLPTDENAREFAALARRATAVAGTPLCRRPAEPFRRYRRRYQTNPRRSVTTTAYPDPAVPHRPAARHRLRCRGW